MKTQTYEDAVLKVVMWWSDKSFNTIMNQNNGDNSEQGGLISIWMNTASMEAQNKLTPAKKLLFETKLAELLMTCDKYDRTLSVDYHPDKLLNDAAKYAGIDPACFPCKSCTRIDDNNIATAKYQYGNPFKEI